MYSVSKCLTSLAALTVTGLASSVAVPAAHAQDILTFDNGAAAPAAVTGNFDFDTDSAGTSVNPLSIHTQLSDVSNGITATFSSPNDSPASGSFRIASVLFGLPGFSGNSLDTVTGQSTPLSVAFDRTLQSGSVAFYSNQSSGTIGVFTVQETLNGVAVGVPTTSSKFGTVSFGGTDFDGLLLSDTDSQFAIDTLIVSGTAPVPEVSTTVSFGLLLALGLGGLTGARKRKSPYAEL